MKLFDDRADAGRQLAQRLNYLGGQDVVILGLPRGGVPVAFEVAKALQALLDVLLVRKLGVPFQPELAFGAIGEDGVRVLNDDVVRAAHLDGGDMDAVEREQRVELRRRAERVRRARDGRATKVVHPESRNTSREVVLSPPSGKPSANCWRRWFGDVAFAERSIEHNRGADSNAKSVA